MNRDDIRNKITGQFYQTLAESDVEITSVPQKELQAIINGLADGLVTALDAVGEADAAMRAAVPVAAAAPAPEYAEADGADDALVEKSIWRGRPYMSIGVVYELTNQRIKIMTGVLSRQTDSVELIRVRDIQVKQHLGERMLNIGDITIFSEDVSVPEILLENVTDPEDVHELIRNAVLEEKERRRLQYREEM
ncbi:MAG: PH domain-containing protein [Chloroflexota bacterium]